MSDARRYEIKKINLSRQNEEERCLQKIEDCIYRAKKELDNRERGIPGEATPEQLEYIIKEMESLYRSVKTRLFTWKNCLKRFTCYDKAEKEWNWRTIQMTTLHTFFKRIHQDFEYFELLHG